MRKPFMFAMVVTLILGTAFPQVNSWRKKDLEFREAFYSVFTLSHNPGTQGRVDFILTRDRHALADIENLLGRIDQYIAHPYAQGGPFQEFFEKTPDTCRVIGPPEGLWPRDMFTYMRSAPCSQYTDLGFMGWPLNRRIPSDLRGERLRVLAGIEAAREQFARDRELAEWKGYALDREYAFQRSNYE